MTSYNYKDQDGGEKVWALLLPIKYRPIDMEGQSQNEQWNAFVRACGHIVADNALGMVPDDTETMLLVEHLLAGGLLPAKYVKQSNYPADRTYLDLLIGTAVTDEPLPTPYLSIRRIETPDGSTHFVAKETGTGTWRLVEDGHTDMVPYLLKDLRRCMRPNRQLIWNMRYETSKHFHPVYGYGAAVESDIDTDWQIGSTYVRKRDWYWSVAELGDTLI
jgi:hypothetical protein